MILSQDYLKDLVYKLNGAAIEVHSALGPGLLECTYHQCMVYELRSKNIKFKTEVIIPISEGQKHMLMKYMNQYINCR